MSGQPVEELIACEAFFMQVLGGDSLLQELIGERIYEGVSPQGVGFPYIIFSFDSSQDTNGSSATRIMVRPLYLVKVIDRGGGNALSGQIMHRVDELLTTTRNVVIGDVLIQGCVRQYQVQYPQPIGNIMYRHRGGMYKLFLNRS